MEIERIYQLLNSKGLVQSQYQFDREYLGRPVGHFAYLKTTGQKPTIETLFRLYANTKTHPISKPLPSTNLKFLKELNNYLWNYLEYESRNHQTH